MERAVFFFVVLSAALSACTESAPAAAPAELETPKPVVAQPQTVAINQPLAAELLEKPHFVPGKLPVAAFVAEQAALAPVGRTLVYVGATWCEPCQRFHHALEAGELDQQLQGTRFIDYDLDTYKAQLDADGYSSRLIPLFAVPQPDGRAGDRRIEGSIKGEGAVGNLVPRLRALIAAHEP